MKQAEINLIASFCEGFPKLESFKAREFLFLGGSGDGRNRVPPLELHQNIYRLARLAQIIRSKLGSAIFLTSVYRSIEYNRTLPGAAPNSEHLRGNAMDMIPRKASVSQLRSVVYHLRDQGVFHGGIGTYKSFIHADLGGSNRNWK